jgi:serine protease AprX
MAALTHRFARWLSLAILFTLLSGTVSARAIATPQTSHRYIVQAASASVAERAVRSAGGSVTQQFWVINGVAAILSDAAATRLTNEGGVRLHRDGLVQAAAPTPPPGAPGPKETQTGGYTLYPAAATGVHTLHERKVRGPKTECKPQKDKAWGVMVGRDTEERELQGWGVTVAVIDSGFMQMASPSDWTHKSSDGTLTAANSGRCIVYRDFLPRARSNDNLVRSLKAANSTDQHGHGTHVVSTIADNREVPLASNMNATPIGVAPQVNLLIARALDKDGMGTYGDVISAIQWVIDNKARYNVKVLNLSLYAPVTGPYWADPLGQAAMRAWEAGITVVVAAGNDGPEAGTITVPGNVPYVITVGAVKSGRYTESGFDELANYSARGPTESAFVKPDVLVPATRTIAPMPITSTLQVLVEEGRLHEKAKVDYKVGAAAKQHAYYQLSGTSMAAAQISGLAALMHQADARLTNNQLKARLMSTARPAWDETTNQPVYTVWEQGAGLVDAAAAVAATSLDEANWGMDIRTDLDPNSTTHYWGYTVWDEATGQFLLIDPSTGQPIAIWDGGSRSWSGGSRSWSGGSRSWAGSDSLWAGADRVWAGKEPATSLNTASFSEALVREE